MCSMLQEHQVAPTIYTSASMATGKFRYQKVYNKNSQHNYSTRQPQRGKALRRYEPIKSTVYQVTVRAAVLFKV